MADPSTSLLSTDNEVDESITARGEKARQLSTRACDACRARRRKSTDTTGQFPSNSNIWIIAQCAITKSSTDSQPCRALQPASKCRVIRASVPDG
ncbi:hypothetical protein LB505_011037 [Fusarium chuoi]|nr:hypothetical protein LB505_011037 [Fusarium chuoi]